jgi:hypothetical protein
MIAVGFAYVLGRPPRWGRFGPSSKVAGILVLLLIASIVVPRVEHFLGIHDLSLSTVNKKLATVGQDTTSSGSRNFGTKPASTPLKSPLRFPVALFTVLFRPLPFEAPTPVTLAASIESLFLLGLTLASLRRIVLALRQVRRFAYTAFALVYVVLFVATFASIGNFGILARERVQTLPFFFVLLCAAPRRARGLEAERYQPVGLASRGSPVLRR